MSTRMVRGRALVRLTLGGVVLVLLGTATLRRADDERGRQLAGGLAVVGAIVLLAIAVVLWRRYGGSAGQVHRWSRLSRRNDGVASAWTLLRVASWLAVRRRAKIVRPSFARVPRWRRPFVPATEFATALARVGALRIWSSAEDVTIRIGGPRTGKTGELAGRIVEAPGAVIATSTRTDLVYLTGPIRPSAGRCTSSTPVGSAGWPPRSPSTRSPDAPSPVRR